MSVQNMQVDDQTKPSAGASRCPVTGIGREFNPLVDPCLVDPYLADPYHCWLRARQSEAVFYSPELDYLVVTRYEDIKEQCPQIENGG